MLGQEQWSFYCTQSAHKTLIACELIGRLDHSYGPRLNKVNNGSKRGLKSICSTTTDSRAHLEQLDSHYSKHKLKKASHQNYIIYCFYSNNDPSNYVLNINKLLNFYINIYLKKDLNHGFMSYSSEGKEI